MARYGVFRYGYDTFGLGEAVEGGLVSSIGHQFNVNSIHIVKVPTAKTVWNQFDEHGLTLSTERLTGEKNWEYKRRLMDILVHAANSTYQGMVYGITHELGLALFQPLLINPKVDDDGVFIAPDPYIRFDGAYVYLYSDYKNNMLDWAIDRYELGGNYEHLTRLVDFINTTAFFEAYLTSGTEPYTRSMTVVNQSNRVLVKGETIQTSTRFKLDNSRLVNGSVGFTDRLIFKTEVASAAAVNAAGEYYIDYQNGIVTMASVPEHEIAIRYQYTEYPFKPTASPVILHDITSENFRAKMFSQVLQDDGTYAHGVPTEIGVDIINELLTVVPMYWGL